MPPQMRTAKQLTASPGLNPGPAVALAQTATSTSSTSQAMNVDAQDADMAIPMTVTSGVSADVQSHGSSSASYATPAVLTPGVSAGVCAAGGVPSATSSVQTPGVSTGVRADGGAPAAIPQFVWERQLLEDERLRSRNIIQNQQMQITELAENLRLHERAVEDYMRKYDLGQAHVQHIVQRSQEAQTRSKQIMDSLQETCDQRVAEYDSLLQRAMAEGTDISHRLRASESQVQRMRTEGEQLRAELAAAQQATAAAIAIPRGMTAADAVEIIGSRTVTRS